VLTRELATQNHYPAVDVLESVSRLTHDLTSTAQQELAGAAREALAVYRRNQDLINIGAYPAGSNPVIDYSIRLHEPLKAFLRQTVSQGFTLNESWTLLGKAMTPAPALPPNGDQARPAH
jgi:flagellum-specific ATP synthase